MNDMRLRAPIDISRVFSAYWCLCHSYPIELDQSMHVVENVSQTNLHFGSFKADGSDKQSHDVLLVCRSAFNVDPLSAPKYDPTRSMRGGPRNSDHVLRWIA